MNNEAYLLNTATGERTPLNTPLDLSLFYDGGLAASMHESFTIFDGKTGALKWTAAVPKSAGSSGFKFGSKHVTTRVDNSFYRIYDSATGQVLLTFGDGSGYRYIPKNFTYDSFQDEKTIFVHEYADGPSEAHASEILVIKQIRPTEWYGPAYLPEFWLSIGLLCALIWSSRRDYSTL